MGYTNPRAPRLRVVAAAHQTAFGTAASSGGTLVRAQCVESAFLRGQVAIDPQGTNGSEYARDYRTEVAMRPRARLRFVGASRAFLALLLEHALHGQPTATSAAGDLAEAGDPAGVLGTWSLTGIRPTFNTDAANILYVKLEDETPGAGQARVSLYKDSARTSLVAQGSAANGATATLAEQNSSGLSGTVVLGTVSASNLTGVTLSVARVRPARAATIARYFTMFRDSGRELEKLTDCVIARLMLESDGRGPGNGGSGLVVTADIVASTYTAPASSAIAPSVAAAELEAYAHANLAVTVNAVAQSALRFSHGIEHDVTQHVANEATPAAIWKRSSRLLPIELVERFADESRTVRDDGAAATWRQIVATHSYAGKALAFTYPRCVLADPELPETEDAGWKDHALRFEARDDGTNAPVSVALDM